MENRIRRRQAAFNVHITRRSVLENFIATEKLEGAGDRGRQRKQRMDSLAAWTSATRNRGVWKGMVATALRQRTSSTSSCFVREHRQVSSWFLPELRLINVSQSSSSSSGARSGTDIGGHASPNISVIRQLQKI